MSELTRESVMNQLYITEGDIILFPVQVMEKVYCAGILNQGTDVAAKTFAEITKLRDLVFGEKK